MKHFNLPDNKTYQQDIPCLSHLWFFVCCPLRDSSQSVVAARHSPGAEGSTPGHWGRTRSVAPDDPPPPKNPSAGTAGGLAAAPEAGREAPSAIGHSVGPMLTASVGGKDTARVVS